MKGADTIRDFTPGLDKLGLYGMNPALVTTAAGTAGLTVAYGGEVLAHLLGVAALQSGDMLFA